ncbi:hypothetical protein [Nocardiopsis sp. FIRDI 009]|uniref:hypothetical protein n=1 Tax=Nocardiopsis sp. FIRDI 009 TaxID=714197 RepID=UPI000E287BD8|nr:hypothetical protein [Nocardiopsis sp. FIRDI 009]
MPRLSHVLDLAPVDREVVTRSVAAAHEVVRSCRFDGRGWLRTPEAPTRERLARRAEELGLLDREGAERLRAAAADRSPERATTTALQLRSGRHLAPRSHYLVAELTADGVPLEPRYEEQGWSSTGLTVTSWDEAGTCALEYAMPDGADTGETPVTSGTVAHHASGVLTATMRIQLPGRLPRWRTASGTLTVDTGSWYAALDGAAAEPPVRLSATHALADVEAWLSPTVRDDGRWEVSAVLDVRGRGLIARPMAALVVWAVRGSFRREARRARRGHATEVVSPRERLDRVGESWDRVAGTAWQLPDYLRDVARAMAEAPGARPSPRPDA